MHLKSFAFCVVLILSSCSGDDRPYHVELTVEPENTMDFDAKEELKDSLKDPEAIPKNSVFGLNNFLAHYEETFDTFPSSQSLLLDRFSFKSYWKKGIVRRQAVAINDTIFYPPKATIWHITYQDSAQLSNVLRNWFLEFGDNRTEIYIGKNNWVRTQPGVFIINSNSISVISAKCKRMRAFTWEPIFKSFRRTMANDQSTIFRVDCDGELIWEQFSLPEEEEEDTETDQEANEDIESNESP